MRDIFGHEEEPKKKPKKKDKKKGAKDAGGSPLPVPEEVVAEAEKGTNEARDSVGPLPVAAEVVAEVVTEVVSVQAESLAPQESKE